MDVLAELVPPPPEFAAPPPGHPSKGGQPVTQMQALTQQRQQLQQMRREQLLRHSVTGMGSQPPPIPTQPPPATLPHLCPSKEQIRILSPTPMAQTSAMGGHQSHTQQQYPRVHNQVIPIDPIDRNSYQFYDSFANHNSLYY